MRNLTRLTVFALAAAAPSALAAPPGSTAGAPTVTLDAATLTGVHTGALNAFLGIPFAQPPVGDLRLRRPASHAPYTGTLNASAFGLVCTQQAAAPLAPPPDVAPAVAALFAPATVGPAGEDCLTVNVWTRAGLDEGVRLPVAFVKMQHFGMMDYLTVGFAGGFADGSSKDLDPSAVINRSIAMGKPMVYVAANYRLNAFGFLGGKEIKAAGVANLGLHDQREALRWVQKYISAFNGDPTKVTIWGQSAGAISVSLQLLAHRGAAAGLFRGAFMQSGGPIPAGDVARGQAQYDALVAAAGCAGAADTLACLRRVPYADFAAAMNLAPSYTSYRALAFTWQPRADGVFLTDDFQTLVAEGSVADVPFVAGNVDDEGTAFSLSTLNITTDAQFRSWVQEFWYPNATSTELDTLLRLYPADPAAGSPFGTGDRYALTPQFKRIAAFQGDYVFQAPRRFFVDRRAEVQKAWGYLWQRGKSNPYFGSIHEADLFALFGGADLADYLINFVNDLDPNGPTVPSWPRFDARGRRLLTFLDGAEPLNVSRDTYRAAPMAFVQQLSLKYPV